MGFRFQQFNVDDDHCGHRVGTDGILLGAWADVHAATRILDIGTGSGLIALMLAQRTHGPRRPGWRLPRIDAIEIDGSAAAQAQRNAVASPWADRLAVRTCALAEHLQWAFRHKRKYDLIVCNPPYFQMTAPPERRRKLARHSADLTYDELFRAAEQLLFESGSLQLIWPASGTDERIESAAECGLMCSDLVYVRPLPHATPKRALCKFRKLDGSPPTIQELVIEKSKHVYTREFRRLTRGFHLAHA